MRRVPELIYVTYPTQHAIPGYPQIDWEFLKKDVIPNVNTMVSHRHDPKDPFVANWKGQGRKLYTNTQAPGQRPYNPDLTVDEALQFWANDPSFSAPTVSGSLGNEYDAAYFDLWPIWAEAIRRLKGHPTMSDKAYLPYSGQMYSFRPGRAFLRAVIENGGYVAQKLYLRSPATEAEADQNIDRWFVREQKHFEELIPGVTQRKVLVIGYLSGAAEGLDTYADVSFKTFMDKELEVAANDPALFGAYGVMHYDAIWADEEYIRWGGRLLRHYCIEGRRERFSKDPYKLKHVLNPDFTDGSSHWELEPAKEGSISAGYFESLYWLQGRFTREKQADTFLLTERCGNKPNRFSQDIKGLEPGRLYSLKMYTSDYDDLRQSKSARKTLDLSIVFEGAEELPEKRGDYVYSGTKWHQARGFDAQNEGWFNYHLRLFRARDTSARLVISDWRSDTEASGPVGQKLMFSGVRIGPYYAD